MSFSCNSLQASAPRTSCSPFESCTSETVWLKKKTFHALNLRIEHSKTSSITWGWGDLPFSFVTIGQTKSDRPVGRWGVGGSPGPGAELCHWTVSPENEQRDLEVFPPLRWLPVQQQGFWLHTSIQCKCCSDPAACYCSGTFIIGGWIALITLDSSSDLPPVVLWHVALSHVCFSLACRVCLPPEEMRSTLFRLCCTLCKTPTSWRWVRACVSTMTPVTAMERHEGARTGFMRRSFCFTQSFFHRHPTCWPETGYLSERLDKFLVLLCSSIFSFWHLGYIIAKWESKLALLCVWRGVGVG